METSQFFCEGQLPMRFILPSESSLSSNSSRLFFDRSEESEVLRGLTKLQSVEMYRKRVKACFKVWASGVGTLRETGWEMGEKDSYFRYRHHRPRMISQHSDLPPDVLTEASTPGVFDFAHKDLDRLARLKTVSDCECQTDPQPSFSPSSLLALRSQFFPQIDPGAAFWPGVLRWETDDKAERLKLYEENVIRISGGGGGVQGGGGAGGGETVAVIVNKAKEWAEREREELSVRRKELEDVYNSLRTQGELNRLETKVEGLMHPGREDLRMEYAHLMLDRQALELERRLLELRQEELIAHRELLNLPYCKPTPDRSQLLSSTLRKWAMFSLRTQPISLQLVPIALLLLQAQCRLSHRAKTSNRRLTVLKSALRTRKIRERLSLKDHFRLFYFRTVEKRVLDFQQSGYSPSISYTSIGDECSVRSPQGLFVLKSMELISESNRSAALGRLDVIARRWREKEIGRKMECWRRWHLHSLTMEVKYYRTLLRSIDSLLQSLKKSDQYLLSETTRSQARISSKLTQVTSLISHLLPSPCDY